MIPEGLPLCVTLSLSKAASDLASHNILAKSLAVVETLGSVDVLCSDKTGTLTTNVMTVVSCLGGSTDEFNAVEGRDRIVRNDTSEEVMVARNIQLVAGLCNGAKFEGGKEDIVSLTDRKVS